MGRWRRATMRELHPQDDGRRWGYIWPVGYGTKDIAAGTWVELPKLPLLRAGLGPPPFEVMLPGGSKRLVVHDPAEASAGA